MTGLPPAITEADRALAASADEFKDLAAKRAQLLRQKLSAFDDLLRERQKIRDELSKLEALLADELDARHGAKSGRFSSERSEPASEPSSIVPGEFAEMSVADAVREVLRREHRKMFTGELVAHLRAGGRALNSKNPSSQVNASIRTMDDVFYSEKHKNKAKWGLVEWRKDGEEES